MADLRLWGRGAGPVKDGCRSRRIGGPISVLDLGVPISSPNTAIARCLPLCEFATRSSGPAKGNPRARMDATMSTFKEKLYAICAEVASEFEGGDSRSVNSAMCR